MGSIFSFPWTLAKVHALVDEYLSLYMYIARIVSPWACETTPAGNDCDTDIFDMPAGRPVLQTRRLADLSENISNMVISSWRCVAAYFSLISDFFPTLNVNLKRKGFWRGWGKGIGGQWPKMALECTICDPKSAKKIGGGPQTPPKRGWFIWRSFSARQTLPPPNFSNGIALTTIGRIKEVWSKQPVRLVQDSFRIVQTRTNHIRGMDTETLTVSLLWTYLVRFTEV